MATSEIEKLERRYAENPQGLTFAPLAEVHRKNGEVARALELLRAGLELHPNYIPASIVLGRCHWDLGDLPAAESAFAHVLRLDDENVIALKSLADINERLERLGEAQRWLNRLVSIDRSNEEARQQLTRLQAAKEKGDRPAERTAAAPAAQDRAGDEIAALDLTAAIAEPGGGSKGSDAPAQEAAAKSSELEFLDTSQPAQKAADTDSAVETKGPPAPEVAAPVAGLISQEFEPPKETYRLHPELTREFVAGKESSDRLDVETAADVELRSSGATEFRVPNAAEDFMDLAARLGEAREGATPDGSAATAEVHATVGRTPPAANPVEPPTAAGLERAAPERIREGSTPSYAARDTKGQSVASFFEALLASRPPTNSGSPGSSSSPTAQSGTSTRPAEDALSLGSVFGEESVPVPPAVPAPGQAKDGVVSFDDFFGSSGGGASPTAEGTTDPRNEDLDQFQSWLQNLKR